MPKVLSFVSSCLILAACAPDSGIAVDGRAVPDLATAAERARAGSHVTLAPGAYEAGVTLPDGVWLDGTGATLFGDPDRPLVASGDLTVTGITFTGGSDVEGSALYVDGDLTVESVVLDGVDGELAIRALGSVDATHSDLSHAAGTAMRVLTRTGRPPQIALREVVGSGVFDIPADYLEIEGLEGSAEITSFGHAFVVRDSQLRALELTGPSAHLVNVTTTDGAFVDTYELSALEIAGGHWQLEVDELTASDILVERLTGRADSAVIAGGLATELVLTGQGVEIDGFTAEHIEIHASRLATRSLRARTLVLDGTGSASNTIVDGPAPVVELGVLDVAALAVRATQAPVRMQLEGTLVRGMVVLDPVGSALQPSLDTTSYANLFNVTWHGSGVAAFEQGELPVWFFDSIFSRASVGHHVAAAFEDSVVWDPAGVTGEPIGAIVEDPGFVSPTDPHLLPDSDWRDAGAFAGPTGAFVEALWAQLQ